MTGPAGGSPAGSSQADADADADAPRTAARGRRRRGRRAVALSPLDAERAAAGEDVFAPAPGTGSTYLPEAGAGDSARAWGDAEEGDAADARETAILREVPPHWHGGRGA